MKIAYFIYNNQKFQFDRDSFDNYSSFFSRKGNQNEEEEYYELLSEFDCIPYLSNEVIKKFLSFFTDGDIQITNNNVFILNLLSHKYEISKIISVCFD